MHVHLIGVAGTGMGSFAGLLKALGHRVTGSDTAFHPPMGDALRAYGVETVLGFDPAHLEPPPDLVVVGNVCRPSNPEARAAVDRGLNYKSFPKAYAELVLGDRRSLVVTGTHGKTTTTALVAFLLDALGLDPTFLVGGLCRNFDASFRLGRGSLCVTEGDEYDSAFFEKVPKCWSYRPWSAILTSLEHDHLDIYPTPDSYRDAFRGFVSRLSPSGVLVAHGADPEVRRVACEAPGRVVYYGLAGDPTPEPHARTWEAAAIAPSGAGQPFELFVGGSLAGRFVSPLVGEHNLRNVVGALCLLSEALGLPPAATAKHLPRFQGVKRRQEVLGAPGGVTVYDDFAHHPTAVRETLLALKTHHPGGRLVAVFEPRSATACRRLHQDDYPGAFTAADLALIAPVGRKDLADNEKLDVPRLVQDLGTLGVRASTVAPGDASTEALVALVTEYVHPGDVVAVLSNGAFGGFHGRLLEALGAR
ncbi:MAG: UDP-N-acetylmuramate:L-alanyl-gamma-D-glutamyl-meso-diaminopimelate ligase [Deltaproteobacteria bacterium]|nr:UDP-N-acetylmuramate:L-alanyl-gamma-D-glutamyl-meso-diaminopimelate ligase [Deltaproteobacteria bacterium]